MKWLTKSDYIHGFLVSPALLWLRKHEPEKLPEVAEPLQYRFDVGHKLNELARQKFPGGILIEGQGNDSLEATQKAMAEHKVVYEAAMLANDRLYARADIVVKNGDAWDMYEVKSAASYHRHPEYLLDLAFQKYVWEQAGIKVGTLGLVLINTHYEKKGEIDPSKLFYTADVTDSIPELVPKVKANIQAALKIIDQPTCPQLDPLDCEHLSRWLPIYEHLAGALPEESIFRLAFLSKDTARKLMAAGFKNITDIDFPDQFQLSPQQRGQWQALKDGQPTVRALKISNYLRRLKYPLYFLDYETAAPAVPIWDGTRPYQTVPFQYSIQVVDEPGAKPRELKYLHTGSDNPMPDLIASLEKHIGQTGSVIVWSGYERGVNRAVAAHYPQHQGFFNSLNRRLFDLMQVFYKQMYIDAGFFGSASIKKVLPVLVPELKYEDLNITEGQTASNRWVQAITGELSAAEAKQVFKDLEVYCGQDTMAMVKIYEFLTSLAEQAVPKLPI